MSVVVGAFVIGLSQISSFFPYRFFNEEWMELKTSKEDGKITSSGLETFQESSG